MYNTSLTEFQIISDEIYTRDEVVGVSALSIVMLLSKDILKLVLFAIVIASLLAWYATNQWLSDFAYRIGIAWWMFALSGLLTRSIALMRVSF